jgi:predicted protein tyrosine phosphatase
MNVLFVCNQNKLRSPTAERIFSSYPEIITSSAGLSTTAEKPLSGDQVEWADLIFVMDKNQLNIIRKEFKAHIGLRKIVNLDIPDEYDYMDEILIRLLEMKATKYFVPK